MVSSMLSSARTVSSDVIQTTPFSTASRRIRKPSRSGVLPFVSVLTTNCASPSRIKIKNVRRAFAQLIHSCYSKTSFFKRCRRSARCNDFVAKLVEAAQDFDASCFIFIRTVAIMEPAGGILMPAPIKPLYSAFAKLLVAAHNFTGRFHFRSQCRINTAKLRKGEYRYFNRDISSSGHRPLIAQISKLRVPESPALPRLPSGCSLLCLRKEPYAKNAD